MAISRSRFLRHRRPLYLAKQGQGSFLTETVGFGFQGLILDNRHAVAIRVAHSAGALLDHMRKLVGKQLLPMRCVRAIVARGEVDIRSPCESDGADGSYFGAHVDAHIRKIRVQGGFHFRLDFSRQRPTAGLRLHVHLKRLDTRMELPLNGRTRCA